MGVGALGGRSHSIFTLRIFMKVRAVEEDELIRTGTLHLVDLAGSESVGRSGAQVPPSTPPPHAKAARRQRSAQRAHWRRGLPPRSQ